MLLSPLPHGLDPGYLLGSSVCCLGLTAASMLSRDSYKSASEKCFKEQHVMHFASFGG